ncbi:MAG: T9SS type A sorting domain-containing protein [Bacteroidales bacterium]|jgi:hypothetical protein|nr:T9SS type A sorting domain-containing protein [Bacteroidales bacterium]
MKQVFFIISLFAVTAVVTAQTYEQIPDGDFEQWTTGRTYGTDGYDVEPYDELANPFYQTLNLISSLPPEMSTGPIVFWKTEGRSGYAPKAKSDTLWVGTTKVFLPGVWGAFTLNIPEKTAHFGRPFHSRPDSLVGYMKYLPVNGDSAYIFVDLYKSGITRRTIGKARQYFRETISEWTRFSMPVEYLSDETPDSVTVLFIASGDIKEFADLFHCDGQTGSTIWADEVKFIYNDQIHATEVKQRIPEAIVYPNPTNGDVFVKTTSPVRKGKIEIYDIKGSVVKMQEFDGTNTVLDLRSLKPAVYMYRVVSDKKTLESGRINLVK